MEHSAVSSLDHNKGESLAGFQSELINRHFLFKGCALLGDRRRGTDGRFITVFATKETAASNATSTKIHGSADAEQYAKSQ